jgi:3-oxoadipate enol-lactonase
LNETPGPAPLFVRELGSGPPVLFLHGLGSDHTVWNGIVPAVGAGHTLLLPDLRGHGQSPAPESATFAFDEHEEDLAALLETKRVGPVHLVGLSAGGFLALRFALSHAAAIRSLVLVGTSAICDGHTRAVAAHWTEVYRTAGLEAYAFRLAKDLYSPGWLANHAEVVEQMVREWKGRDLRGPIQWYSAVRSFDMRASVGRIRAPTWVVHGMDDRVIDPTHARFLRHAIPGAQLKLFPYAGHMVPVEQAEEFGRLLREWIDTHDAAGPSAPPPAAGPAG